MIVEGKTSEQSILCCKGTNGVAYERMSTAWMTFPCCGHTAAQVTGHAYRIEDLYVYTEIDHRAKALLKREMY